MDPGPEQCCRHTYARVLRASAICRALPWAWGLGCTEQTKIPTVQELADLLVVTRGRCKPYRSQLATRAMEENRSVRCSFKGVGQTRLSEKGTSRQGSEGSEGEPCRGPEV